MLDLKMKSDIADVPVPLPGRVMLFANGEGVMCARLHDGSVLSIEGAPGADGAPGPSTMPQLTALDIGAIGLFSCNTGANGTLTTGNVISSVHALFSSIKHNPTVTLSTVGGGSSTTAGLVSGQTWRILSMWTKDAILMQRVS